MSFHDDLGLACTGADADSAAHYRRALHQFRCYIEDPVASVDAALALRPDFVMAHVLKAWLHLLGTEPGAIPVARGCLAAASRRDVSARSFAAVAPSRVAASRRARSSSARTPASTWSASAAAAGSRPPCWR